MPVVASSLGTSMPAGPSVAGLTVRGSEPPGCSSVTSDMRWSSEVRARGCRRTRPSSPAPAGGFAAVVAAGWPRCSPARRHAAARRAAQARFDALRRAHFPPERNHLAAHVTLFHALPGEHERAGARPTSREAAARPPYAVRGHRGCAASAAAWRTTCAAEELAALRRELGRALGAVADAAGRAAAPAARHGAEQGRARSGRARCSEQLSARLRAVRRARRGLALWRYLGGPWETGGLRARRSPRS